jgi:ABC-type molybdate transport system substrate-binding protein
MTSVQCVPIDAVQKIISNTSPGPKLRAVNRFSAMALIFACLSVGWNTSQAEDGITIAAAADLQFALDKIVASFMHSRPAVKIETIYGSSGKFSTQILQGAPYDIYFSADIVYPRALKAEGWAASEVQTYGIGRIALSLAPSPELAKQGSYALISDTLHQPSKASSSPCAPQTIHWLRNLPASSRARKRG